MCFAPGARRFSRSILVTLFAAAAACLSCISEPIQSIYPLATPADTLWRTSWSGKRRDGTINSGESPYWNRLELAPGSRSFVTVPFTRDTVRVAAHPVRLGIQWYLEVGPISVYLPNSTSWLGGTMPDSTYLIYRLEERADTLVLRPLSDWGVHHFNRFHPGSLRLVPLVRHKESDDEHWFLMSETSELRHFLGHFGPADSLFCVPNMEYVRER